MPFKLVILLYLLSYSTCHQDSENEDTSNKEIKISVNQETGGNISPAPTKISEIELPSGFYRQKTDTMSFAYYLRNLPLNTKDNTIYSYDGSIISQEGYHHSIIDIDIGKRDLQQCADAIMRLRAEYLYQHKLYEKIHFNFLSDGKPRYFTTYSKGDYGYISFRKYLDYIFSYANSSSLCDEMLKLENVNDMQIGDCFVQKGYPIGHAVIVIDIAIHKKTGEKICLIAQSFMPAQSIHILSNLNNAQLDPWYPVHFKGDLILPTWTFHKKDLRRFK